MTRFAVITDPYPCRPGQTEQRGFDSYSSLAAARELAKEHLQVGTSGCICELHEDEFGKFIAIEIERFEAAKPEEGR